MLVMCCITFGACKKKNWLHFGVTGLSLQESSDSESGGVGSFPVPGVTGLGYAGRGDAVWRGGGGASEWERGANLKEYFAKRDEQEAQAVGVLMFYPIILNSCLHPLTSFSFLQTLESEEVDLNANLHGNWTLENAKARLNQFFQKERITADYKYSQVGPDHNRSDLAVQSDVSHSEHPPSRIYPFLTITLAPCSPLAWSLTGRCCMFFCRQW